MTQLSFKKLSSIPTSDMTAGTIMFNSTTHSIFVATSPTDAEEYGGRLEDVTYSEGILTITKFPETAGGSKEVIKLDFSDAASASDVTRVLKGLYSRVTAVEEDLNGSSTVPKGLKKRVEDLESSMGIGDDSTSLVSRVSSAETDIDTLQKTVYGTLKEDGTRDTNGLESRVGRNENAIADLPNKTYVDNAISTAISTVYKIKGCIAGKDELVAITSPSNGDVYNVVAEVIVNPDDVDSETGKFGAAGTYSAGTNWVWIQHTTSTSQTESETTTTGHWDALGGMITGYATSSDVTDLTERVGKLENGENTVKTFGGQYGVITVDADNTTNGMVTFKMNGKELQGTTYGLKAAAYKAVETTLANDADLPTGAAVTGAINKQVNDLNNTISNLSVINWAEWK